MHLLQSKEGTSGGPQYWLQDIEKWLANHLEKERACQIVLQTPYGITKTSFNLLHPDWKFGTRGKVKSANAQHYRVQADQTNTSIGTAIQRWYGIKRKVKRIDVSVNIHDGHFILTPTRVTTSGADRAQILEKVSSPLSFHKDYQSKLWRRQIETCRNESSTDVDWAGSQIKRVVAGHQKGDVLSIHEAALIWGFILSKVTIVRAANSVFLGCRPIPVRLKSRNVRHDLTIRSLSTRTFPEWSFCVSNMIW